MKKQIPTIIIALFLAITIGSLSFGISALHKKKTAEEENNQLRMQITRMKAPLPDTDPATPLTPYQQLAADTNALTKLEAEVARLDAELAAEKQKPPQREGWAERMDRMKEENPEGYAEIVKRRKERQEAIRYNLAERTANFVELDTAFMTDSERENHELLIEKMSNVWKLTEQFGDTENPPNRESMHQLFAAIQEARPLMDMERNTMFRQLANDLGYDGEETQDFSNYIEDIISATTIQPPRGGSGRHF